MNELAASADLGSISAASRRYLGRISGPFPQVFSRFDDDGSGSIEIGEFGELLGALGIHLSDAETARALELLDPNGDGSISWEAARSSRLGLLPSFDAVPYKSAGEIPREICPLITLDVPASPHRRSISRGGRASTSSTSLISTTPTARGPSQSPSCSSCAATSASPSRAARCERRLRRRDDSAPRAVHVSQVREALRRLDRDGSETLTFDEFMPWWQTVRELRGESRLQARRASSAHARHVRLTGAARDHPRGTYPVHVAQVHSKGGRWEDNLFLGFSRHSRAEALKARQREVRTSFEPRTRRTTSRATWLGARTRGPPPCRRPSGAPLVHRC